MGSPARPRVNLDRRGRYRRSVNDEPPGNPDDDGLLEVTTASGAIYWVDLAGHRLQRRPRAVGPVDTLADPSAELRRDGHWVPSSRWKGSQWGPEPDSWCMLLMTPRCRDLPGNDAGRPDPSVGAAAGS